MKHLTLLSVLLLSGCSGERPLILPDREHEKFSCDMDPYKQGCERMKDYQEHFRLIKTPVK